jgi:predicted DNA-binding transcriptional regulator YafY
VFEEDPIDVVLRFTPEAVEDGARWLFHLSQTVTHEADGSLTVRFRAGGMLEMCWRLFSWGAAATVVAPDSLRKFMAETTMTVAQHYAATPSSPDPPK